MGQKVKLRVKSAHQQRVEAFLRGHGRPVPDHPSFTSEYLLLAWGKLLLEETLEALEAAGLEVRLAGPMPADAPLGYKDDCRVQRAANHQYSLAELAKELADVSVIQTGFMTLCGIADENVLKAVDDNNMLKIETGTLDRESGKLVKHPDHPKADVKSALREQGWDG